MMVKLSKRGENLHNRTVRCTQTIAKRLHKKEEIWMNALSSLKGNWFTPFEAADVWRCAIGTARNRLYELLDAKLVEREQYGKGRGVILFRYMIKTD